MKVTIRLIHAPTETPLWARNYERALTDVLKLQDEMSQAIADEIRIQITPEDRARMSAARAVNPAAHEAYLLGRFHFWKFIIDDHKRAIEHFKRAIQIDPVPALSRAVHGECYESGRDEGCGHHARAAARTGLDDRLARPTLGAICSSSMIGTGRVRRFDHPGPGLDPNNLEAHFYYSPHPRVGRFPQALPDTKSRTTRPTLSPGSDNLRKNSPPRRTVRGSTPAGEAGD
jgi:hypothetical protein